MLIVGDKIWELRIAGQFDSSGTYTQRSEPETDIADIVRVLPANLPSINVGHAETHTDRSLTLCLNDNGAYPGKYHLQRQ
jgi:hypothetical protein